MRLGRCEAHNFGSYAHLDFDFSSPGLSLICGKTGSGKSMLADLPCWILYGVTAKNGTADSVRSWQAPDRPTTATLSVQLQDGDITVTRIRGRASQNDLYWTEGQNDEKQRGKDLTDTQRLLNGRIGIDSTLYLIASYFCDFSPSGSFFVDKAPARRELFEKITSLALPIKIAARTSETRKETKKELDAASRLLSKASGKLEQLTEADSDLRVLFKEYEDKRCEAREDNSALLQLDATIQDIAKELERIDALRPDLRKVQDDYQDAKAVLRATNDEYKRLLSIGDKECPLCMSPQKDQNKRRVRLEELSGKAEEVKLLMSKREEKIRELGVLMNNERVLKDRLQKAQTSRAVVRSKLQELANAVNPYSEQLVKNKKDKTCAEKELAELSISCQELEHKIARMTRLYDLSFELRGELLKKAVKQIEINTNALLEQYFDAELTVTFSVESGDNIEVLIQKSGFECSFKQLSKGQRQLLKLCFSVSIMQVSANAAGVSFDNVFMDEPTDGLDADLKVKAFNLFENIAVNTPSVFIIEHSSELQAMFSNKYFITLEGDESVVEHENSKI
jgi:DNA repair exonuclease SbcCD ATPase subunit